MAAAARALIGTKLLCIYDPFKRGGKLTSEGDADFDTSLRTFVPEIEYKDVAWIKSEGKKAHFEFLQAIDMPANNLALYFRDAAYVSFEHEPTKIRC